MGGSWIINLGRPDQRSLFSKEMGVKLKAGDTLATLGLICLSWRFLAGDVHWKLAIAVTDPNGELIYFYKMDSTQNASVNIAINKARTAARFRRESAVFAGLMSTPARTKTKGAKPRPRHGSRLLAT